MEDRTKRFTEMIKKGGSETVARIKKAKDDVTTIVESRKAEKQEEKKNQQLNRLVPVFEGDLEPDSFLNERIIRVINFDARVDNDLYKDCVGFYEKTDDRKILTVYAKNIQNYGLSFFPHFSESVFIADPCIPRNYIEINNYFSYMKQVRVNELTLIAQSLGAKHVEIRLKQADKEASSKSMKTGAAGAFKTAHAKLSFGKNMASKSENAVEVWASTDFKTGLWGGKAQMPEVVYFRNESDIQSLIQMVLNGSSKVSSRTYSFKASSSSGISTAEATSIGASLKTIKADCFYEFEKEAARESESVLEYTIVF